MVSASDFGSGSTNDESNAKSVGKIGETTGIDNRNKTTAASESTSFGIAGNNVDASRVNRATNQTTLF